MRRRLQNTAGLRPAAGQSLKRPQSKRPSFLPKQRDEQTAERKGALHHGCKRPQLLLEESISKIPTTA
jgi:hypothetical protein